MSLPPALSTTNVTATTVAARAKALTATPPDPEMRRAAEGMEAMFLDYLMKVMRQTVPKNEMDLESPATDLYRGMLDSEIASQAARTGSGVGLADQIIAYLQSERYTLKRGGPSAVSEGVSGGSHESYAGGK